MMSSEERERARPLAKADFDAYIDEMPAAQQSLADLVEVLARLDGVESFSVLKRRNQETEPRWECEPFDLESWLDVVDDGYEDGLRELNRGMVEQIVRLCRMPTLKRLSLNCRIPSFVWGCHLNLEDVNVKGVLGGADPGCVLWGDIKRELDEEEDIQRYSSTPMSLVAYEGDPGGIASLVDEVPASLRRVKEVRFDIPYRGQNEHEAIETWLYRFLNLASPRLERLELVVEELPKIRSPGSEGFDTIPELPLLHSLRVSFKTGIRSPRVWKRVGVLLEPILVSAPNVSELSLEMKEPGTSAAGIPSTAKKTFTLIEELDQVVGNVVAQHLGMRTVNVRIEHDCNSLDQCKERVANKKLVQACGRTRKGGYDRVGGETVTEWIEDGDAIRFGLFPGQSSFE
ncbi:hypothetical protein NMY22_g1678 [Coprinellus aureogranulatus]|nr:hypothetical protein NMY22_g1678 [Coprinellus aureogranulatus]